MPTTLSDPARNALDGDGRIAGRLVACDVGRVTTDEILRRLGAMSVLPDRTRMATLRRRGWKQLGENRDELACSLLPLVGTGLLDRLGPDGARSLTRGGNRRSFVDERRDPAGCGRPSIFSRRRSAFFSSIPAARGARPCATRLRPARS